VISWSGPDLEPLGSTVLIAGLGTIAARRAFKDAERLVALDKELSIARRIQSLDPARSDAERERARRRRALPADDAVAGDSTISSRWARGAWRPGGGRVRPRRARGAHRVDGQVAIAAQKHQAHSPAAVLPG